MHYRARWWDVRLALVFAVTVSLAACGTDNTSQTADVSAPVSGNPGATPTPSPSPTPVTSNHAPIITGKAPASVLAGQPYDFTPTATDADNDTITFNIASKPRWASFDTATGRVWGTPAAADVGAYAGVQVAATDGKAVATLRFAVTVTQASTGTSSVTLSWLPPTENTDGTPLSNLTGYKIHYGQKSGAYSDVITIANVGLTRYVVDNLPAGTYYFSITAYTSGGAESTYSPEASTTIG